MAQSINIDPLEIIASLEIGRTRECDKKRITDAYWAATIKTVGSRLDEAGHGGGDSPGGGNRISHNVYYVKFYIARKNI